MSFFSKKVEIGPSGRPIERKQKKEFKKNFFAYLYLLPVLFLIAVFSYYPFFRTVLYSFSKVNINGVWRGFHGINNYINLFEDPEYLNTFLVTGRFVLCYLPLHVMLTLSLALLTNRKKSFSTMYQTMLAAPMAVSMSAACAMLGWLYYGSSGIVTSFLGLFGVSAENPPMWVNDATLGVPSIALIVLWTSIGFDYLLLLSAVRGVPEDLLENASLAGAGGFQKTVHITLPYISPTLFFVICTQTIAALLIVTPFTIMTDGGPNGSTTTMLYYIFMVGFRQGNYTTSSAASVIAFLTTLVFVLFNFLYEKKSVFYGE